MPRSSSVLEGILNDYLVDVPVEVESCAAQWIPIEPQQHNRLGSVNCKLGVDLTVGERVFDRSCTFSVSIGPVGLEAFQRFLPPGDSLAEIRELIDIINSDNLDYYVNLWILQEEIPELRLSSPTAQLGWTTWAGKKPDSSQNVRFLMKGWFHGRR
jgi:type VI secretion system protein ImpH